MASTDEDELQARASMQDEEPQSTGVNGETLVRSDSPLAPLQNGKGSQSHSDPPSPKEEARVPQVALEEE